MNEGISLRGGRGLSWVGLEDFFYPTRSSKQETVFHPSYSKNFLFYGIILTLNFEGVRERNIERDRKKI